MKQWKRCIYRTIGDHVCRRRNDPHCDQEVGRRDCDGCDERKALLPRILKGRRMEVAFNSGEVRFLLIHEAGDYLKRLVNKHHGGYGRLSSFSDYQVSFKKDGNAVVSAMCIQDEADC